jgi:hypothetical protein
MSLPSSAPRMLGSNQVGMREFNERVVLQAVRLHGSLPKAELARLTRLSTQTVSVIINRLLEEGLVVKRDSLRGKVGQPSQPIALAPDGAFSIGVRIGRRRLDVLLLDFCGAVRHRASIDYDTPSVEVVFAEIAVQLAQIGHLLGDKAARLAGVGLAAPLMFGGWQKLVRMSAQDADAWTRTSMRERLQALTPLPVQFAKDTAAACVAELQEELSLPVCRCAHRRRAGDRRAAASRPVRQCRRGGIDAAGRGGGRRPGAATAGASVVVDTRRDAGGCRPGRAGHDG